MSDASATYYFPPETSVLRRVHAERAVGLLYGQRALIIGSLNPIAFIGTTQRSKAKNSPWRRLTHTAKMFETVFFGTREEADRALAFTARLHDRVRGEIPESAGPYPAGTPYSAFDPELMMWVVAPMYESARVLYQLLVRPLSPSEIEQLWQEYLLFGELFGMPRSSAPRTTAALAAWWAEQHASDHVFLTDAARAVGRSIAMKLPLPLWARAPMRAGTHVLIGSLPERVRTEFGWTWTQRDEVMYRALCQIHRTLHPITPRAARRGSCMPFYAAVAGQERRNAKVGKVGFVPDGGRGQPPVRDPAQAG